MGQPRLTPTEYIDLEGTIHKFEGEHAFLSNFYPCPIVWKDGCTYESVGHAYAASHFMSESITERLAGKNEKQVFRLLETNKNRIVSNFYRQGNTDSIMKDFLNQKFSTPEMRRLLVETYPKRILYISRDYAYFWGLVHINNNLYSGANRLGILLMSKRKAFIEEDKGRHERRIYEEKMQLLHNVIKEIIELSDKELRGYDATEDTRYESVMPYVDALSHADREAAVSVMTALRTAHSDVVEKQREVNAIKRTVRDFMALGKEEEDEDGEDDGTD